MPTCSHVPGCAHLRRCIAVTPSKTYCGASLGRRRPSSVRPWQPPCFKLLRPESLDSAHLKTPGYAAFMMTSRSALEGHQATHRSRGGTGSTPCGRAPLGRSAPITKPHAVPLQVSRPGRMTGPKRGTPEAQARSATSAPPLWGFHLSLCTHTFENRTKKFLDTYVGYFNPSQKMAIKPTIT